MATTLVYTLSPFVPFTKILSASVNQYFTDIQNRLNWAGGTSVTTGLSGDNIQSNTASPEIQAALTSQAVTYTAKPGQGANGNNITIQITPGGVAGSESVSVSSLAITIQVASGTSTVTQVVTAVNASAAASALVTATGSGSSTVSTASALNLTGGSTSSGISRGTKLALDTANYVVINSSTGAMTSEAALASSRGGTGVQVIPANQNVGDVFQINSSKTGIVLGAPLGMPAALRPYIYGRYY